jgi:putative pyruvate formate lyase activating enzyme
MTPDDPAPAIARIARQALEERVARAAALLSSCALCGHRCEVDRRIEPAGQCRTAARARVHGFGPHHGEEDCLRGWRGSGTVFFADCNLACVFCQNWEISARGDGEEVDGAGLARIFLELQRRGVHNLNLVTPTHVLPAIVEGLAIAAEGGLSLPLVWNCGGYESLEALSLLDGLVDVYMPDLKYGDSATAERFSGAAGYWEVATAALREMHRQVGDLAFDEAGLARRGLLVRHLVLPEGLAGSERVLEFLAREISPRTAVNVMEQYRPCYRAAAHPPLDRRPTAQEIESVRATARALGLRLLP